MDISPGSKFRPKIRVPSSITNAIVMQECEDLFGFTGFDVYGASGRSVGSAGNERKEGTRNFKVVSGKWKSDEFGEDVFVLKYRCWGSISALVYNSSSYSVNLFKKVYRQDGRLYPDFNNVESPEYSVSELKASGWKIRVKLGVDTEFKPTCCQDWIENEWS